MVSGLQRVLGPLNRRISNMIARAVVRLVSDDTKLQSLQVSLLAETTRDGAERFQQYGFTSHPHVGAEAIVLFPFGNRDHPIVIAVDDRRYRKTGLEPGETALYTDEGDFILMKRGRIVQVVAGAKLDVTAPEVVVAASSKIRFETPLLECTGEIKDRCDADGRSMSEMRETYNDHVHPENDSGGPTDAPTEAM